MPTSRKKKHGSGKVYRQKPPKYDPQYFHDLRESLRNKLKDSLTLEEIAELQKQIRVSTDQSVQAAVDETHNRTWAIVFRVLHDRFGFEVEQKKELFDGALDYLRDIQEGRITTQEMLDTLEIEDGVRLTFNVKET